MGDDESGSRDKGRVLEILVSNVLDDMGLPFVHTCFHNNLNKKGCKIPDHSSDDVNIEDKNWSCFVKKYQIDLHRYHSQIESRFDPAKRKILIIAQPHWSPLAMTVSRINGVHIIALNCGRIQDHYSDCYHFIRDSLKEYFISNGLYCDLLIRNGDILLGNSPLYLRESIREWLNSEIERLDGLLEHYKHYVRLRGDV